MSQQTINVGAAPNDGTGTPLRTAFQYTNANFTELYTAVGPSGNNIVVPGNATITGDLTVDTSTLKVDSANNRVGVGTASPISQFANTNTTDTITGTVTDGFAWRSVSNDWAAAIIARPASGNAYALRAHTGGATASDYPLSLSAGASAGNTVLSVTGNGIFTFGDGAGGTRMTLNSTGLGVGASPSARFHSKAGAVTLGGIIETGGANALLSFADSATSSYTRVQIGSSGNNLVALINGSTALTVDSSSNVGVGVTPINKLQVAASALAAVPAAGASGHMFAIGSTPYGIAAGALTSGNSYIQATRWDGTATNYDLLLQPNGGNVGVGVTPSAWAAGGNIQGQNGFIWSSYDASVGAGYYYASGSYKYISTAAASIYQPFGGAHKWFTAAGSQPAGTNFTPTQAMTLDASGNLLVGTTNTSSTAGPGFKAQYSSTVPQFAIVTNEAGSSTALSLYNVNATAYRFYVNNAGTVFATNTTISAISDARLKENVQDIDVGLGAILALKPRKFDWKEGKGKNIKGDRGFIAQEFEQVFPNLIDEWKDPAPEGEAPYKSVRQDLIPVLVKAIQELTARVEALEA